MWRIFLRSRYIKQELKGILRGLSSEAEVLDAGFGYGQYSYWIARKFPSLQVLSVEIEDALIDDFQNFLDKAGVENITLRRIDLTKMKYVDRFDLVLSVDVMEHIGEDEVVFKNIHRSLKSGGVLLMHTPHIKSGEIRGSGSFVGEHFRDGYETGELVDKLKEVGFSRIECIYTYGKFGSIAWKLLQKLPICVIGKFKTSIVLFPIYFLLVYPVASLLMKLDMKLENYEGNGILVKAWKE